MHILFFFHLIWVCDVAFICAGGREDGGGAPGHVSRRRVLHPDSSGEQKHGLCSSSLPRIGNEMVLQRPTRRDSGCAYILSQEIQLMHMEQSFLLMPSLCLPRLSGPFSTVEMCEWFQAGYFAMNLLVKRGCDEGFQPLGEVIKMWGRVPFAPGPSPPPLLVRNQAQLHPQPPRGATVSLWVEGWMLGQPVLWAFVCVCSVINFCFGLCWE